MSIEKLKDEYNDLKAENTENKLGRETANRECDRLKVEIIALKTENEQLKSLIHNPELFNYFDEIKSNNESLKKENEQLKDQISKYVSEISELKKDLYLSHKQISCFLGESTLR